MNILAIETSCDETAVSLVRAEGDLEQARFEVIGDALYSQAAKHASFGGVYPNLAKREHQENLVPLTIRALTEAKLLQAGECIIYDTFTDGIREKKFRDDVTAFLRTHAKPDIDLIAVTQGPGLEPALWAGISFAKAVATAWNIPIIGIDHMEGHIVSALLKKDKQTFTLVPPQFPVLSLLISGGHTELVLMKAWFEYELIGRTRDDAVGEAFDKVARILGMPYPGGPEIDRAAKRARERAVQSSRTARSEMKKENRIIYDTKANNVILLPRPMIHDVASDFSFSGLKTAVLYLVRDMKELSDEDRENIAREFEDAVRDVLVLKTKRAIEKTGAHMLVVGGGVSANGYIRAGLETLLKEYPDVSLHYPTEGLTGDNAIMIGIAAYMRHTAGKTQNEPVVATGSQTLAN